MSNKIRWFLNQNQVCLPFSCRFHERHQCVSLPRHILLEDYRHYDSSSSSKCARGDAGDGNGVPVGVPVTAPIVLRTTVHRHGSLWEVWGRTQQVNMLPPGTPSLPHSRHLCPGWRFPWQLPYVVPVARKASKPLSISSLSMVASGSVVHTQVWVGVGVWAWAAAPPVCWAGASASFPL